MATRYDYRGGQRYDIVDIGVPDPSKKKKVRLVHISDTHLHHNNYINTIPGGDILIHSGDFGQFGIGKYVSKESDYLNQINELNEFFSKLPHKYKIFVGGNHEMNFSQFPVTRTQSLLQHGIYLQDSEVQIEGIRIYGTPWNGLRSQSFARGFTSPYNKLNEFWSLIPKNIDILVTHQTPKLGRFRLGCLDLREQVLQRIRPKLHCFGHDHATNSILHRDGIVFSNAAMDQTPHSHVFDFYVENQEITDLSVVNHRLGTQENNCIVI